MPALLLSGDRGDRGVNESTDDIVFMLLVVLVGLVITTPVPPGVTGNYEGRPSTREPALSQFPLVGRGVGRARSEPYIWFSSFHACRASGHSR